MSRVKRIAKQSGPMAQAGAVALWGASSIIKSVQSGYLTGGTNSYAATIAAVNPNHCLLLYQNFDHSGSGTQAYYFTNTLTLTDATTITVGRQSAGGAVIGVAWTVLEFLPGVIKSIQAGLITLAAAPGTATVNAVNPQKCMLLYEGSLSPHTGPEANIWPVKLVLTNATTVTASTYTNANAQAAFRLVEFF
jgi:hypothetical protein